MAAIPNSTEKVKSFEFQRIFLPEEYDWTYLLEVGFRTAIMFTIVLVTLKLSGKRSVRQLSFFELAIIVGLGSAAGDPMFYHDVGILPAFMVFVIVATMYKGLTYITKVSDKAEEVIEGKPDKLVDNGLIITANVDTDDLAYDEFFAFLRSHHIEHLGQVRKAFLEANGEISIYFFADDEVKYGLPISPDVYRDCCNEITKEGIHSCTKCAFTDNFKAGQKPLCPHCKNENWLPALNCKRIT